ncbi:MAG TPA: hypothetical protein VII37_09490, partial [Candidatus Acidoferrum sp.]
MKYDQGPTSLHAKKQRLDARSHPAVYSRDMFYYVVKSNLANAAGRVVGYCGSGAVQPTVCETFAEVR